MSKLDNLKMGKQKKQKQQKSDIIPEKGSS
jgi:hypothetical protein